MQGAGEGRSREKVSWASVNAADTSLEVRDEVAASSRAELKEVVMDHPSGPKPHRFICENRVAPLPGRIRTVSYQQLLGTKKKYQVGAHLAPGRALLKGIAAAMRTVVYTRGEK